MRLTRLPSGALQFDIDGGSMAVRKTLHPNGDFELALRGEGDQLTVVRRGEQVRVSRRNRSVDLGTESLGEADLDQLQQVMAGSTAIRRFRAMKSMLAPATRCTAPGAAVDIIDMLIGVLKGESPVPPPAATAPNATVVPYMNVEAEFGGPSCYDTWEAEVVSAWSSYVGCINSFPWYNAYREVCAFAWVLRAESAWFTFIGCSSLPIKQEHSDVEDQARPY